MKFNELMHISFYTEQFVEMVDFYCSKLGMKQKVVVRYKEYLNNPESKLYAKALSDPEGVFYTYIEIAPGQFIELFPAMPGQKPHRGWNEDVGYSHFGLTVEDIYKASEEMQAMGIVPDTGISAGPSGTYKQWFHDPDGNKFELMQYTEKSWQITGYFSE